MAGTRVTFLGSGNAFNIDGRGSQCLAVEAPGVTSFLIDVGPTAMVAMARGSFEASGLDRIFLTHLHGDHVAGWPFLLLHMIILHRRTRPLDVYGPTGTRDCFETLARVCYADVLGRQAFEVRYHELPVVGARGIDAGPGVALDTVPMRHHETSIGLRLRIGGGVDGAHVLGVSGDTAWCDEVELLAEGCDLLVLECTMLEPSEVPHISLREVRERAERLRADRIALTHVMDEIATALAADPIPRVFAAHDGLVVDLAPRAGIRA